MHRFPVRHPLHCSHPMLPGRELHGHGRRQPLQALCPARLPGGVLRHQDPVEQRAQPGGPHEAWHDDERVQGYRHYCEAADLLYEREELPHVGGGKQHDSRGPEGVPLRVLPHAVRQVPRQSLGGRRHLGGPDLGQRLHWGHAAHLGPHQSEQCREPLQPLRAQRRHVQQHLAPGERILQPGLPDDLQSRHQCCEHLGAFLHLQPASGRDPQEGLG
mmetsp:Transcript_56642/g.127821  ORF Transcript_56642/g.127821 Transcript_56642/m.127821 type:complete len:216 (-) Transcript_56642:1337-1984(-)